MIIKFFLKKQLINASLATKLINWRHSGFSVDNAVGIPVFSDKARQSLSQYIARPPLSLKKISIEENGEATVISYTSDNDFFKGKIESFSATRFLLELTQHITPRGLQYIRRYGLYASRTKGKWPDMPHIVRLAPTGWKIEHLPTSESPQPYVEESAYSVSDKEGRSTWAKLIAQVYEGCAPRCPDDLQPMWLIDANSRGHHRAAGDPQDPAPPGEDRPLTAGVRSSFVELAICLPACSREYSVPAAPLSSSEGLISQHLRRSER